MFKLSRISFLSASAGVFGLGLTAHATEFVSQEISFTQGTVSTFDTQYNNPSACLNAPSGTTGAEFGFPGVVSPFNPAFDTDQVVELGAGGSLELKFPTPVPTGPGAGLNVFSNAGLLDSTDFSDPGFQGIADNPADGFGGGLADVQVSQNGTNDWVDLGTINFNIPENYYLNAGPYDLAAPANPQVADFSQPYMGGLHAFDGETYAQIVATLNGAAGGTWINLGAVNLPDVNYVQFSIPSNAQGTQLGIEAVAVAVPEPGSLLAAAGASLLVLRRRRKA